MKTTLARNLFVAALAGLLCGTIGETLVFVESQVRRIEDTLVSDFRIVLFLGEELPDARRKEVESRLRALSGTRDVAFVSRDAALETLRRQDPELARSVALLGENPLASAFEASLEPAAIGRADDWARAAAAIPGVGELRFKPIQVQAIVQCQFYSRFLRLILSLAAFFWIAGAAAAVWAARELGEAAGVLGVLPARLGVAAVGTLGGMGIVLIAALPLRAAPASWAPLSWLSQAALIVVGTLGGLFAWYRARLSAPAAPMAPAEAAAEALAEASLP